MIANLSTDFRTEASPVFDVDGSLWFHSTGFPSGSQVLRAAPLGDGFEAPVVFAPISDGTADDGDPYITHDGMAAVFSSDRAGGVGQADLFIIERSCE